jgi:putative membrane-bound dehydrogenase-like protein
MKKLFCLAFAIATSALLATAADKPRKLVLIAGKPSHPPGMHEFRAGSLLLEKCLLGVPGFKIEVHTNGWVSDEKSFADADAVVIYADGGGGHPAVQGNHKETLGALMKRGVGFGAMHYGVEVVPTQAGAEFNEWIGGHYAKDISVNPIWEPDYQKFPTHPITRGVQPFKTKDEWYFNMSFREGMKGVTPILVAKPSDATRDGPYVYPKGPYPHIQAAKGRDETMMWAIERADGGRGFGFTGGHFHANWGNDQQRKLICNAFLWLAKAEVPAKGIESKISEADLAANLDPKGTPKAPAAKKAETVPAGPAPKAAFTSATVTKKTPGHAVDVDVDITGWKELHLVVNDAGDSFSCDWADWIEPRLVTADGKETKLTDLKWTSAKTDFGQVHIGANVQNQPLKVAGKSVAFGIGTHANSVISYTLPADAKFTRFKARGGLDNGGTDQAGGDSSSVQFQVFASAPVLVAAAAKSGEAKPTAAAGAERDPANALAGLDAGAGLKAQLFAAEPLLLSPSNIEVDHLGRVWVCEVMNYRGRNGSRPEGDRILVLEDTDGDGKADKQTVFYQGRDIDSALGICVLPSLDGKSTRVIVSCAPNVFIFTDTNGDLKSDKQELLFTKVGQPQHDHSTHAFVFGPDGKLYWNVGNTGKGVSDKNGNPITDRAGNVVTDKGQPYRQGLVFRCNPDGSDFEVLGHNFRNNYEVAVDSFGSLWQSDNDDDGNKSVRINFVMEFGNYGYVDELTGAGWNTAWKKANEKAKISDDEKPRFHWHLDDPGVVPTLLVTGQGSPTGIAVYEGDLLPAPFRNQVIHCDAGPNVVRAYPVQRAGAGYTATMAPVLTGTRDKWFRPADVCVAPDGSLLVGDWYDPGVGGHAMGDLTRGRVFRVTVPGAEKYTVPKLDLTSPAGAVAALKSPNLTARYLGYTALKAAGAKAEAELVKLFKSDNARHRARALWLLAQLPNGKTHLATALRDADADLRITALRAARCYNLDAHAATAQLVADSSPAVRRECAVALRHSKAADAPALWAKLAAAHDGQDRWYLEALGLAADRNEAACFTAWKTAAGANWNTPAGRDIIWRSRTPAAAPLLAQLVLDAKTSAPDKARFLRALDFIPKSKEKDDALAAIALGAL